MKKKTNNKGYTIKISINVFDKNIFSIDFSMKNEKYASMIINFITITSVIVDSKDFCVHTISYIFVFFYFCVLTLEPLITFSLF